VGNHLNLISAQAAESGADSACSWVEGACTKGQGGRGGEGGSRPPPTECLRNWPFEAGVGGGIFLPLPSPSPP